MKTKKIQILLDQIFGKNQQTAFYNARTKTYWHKGNYNAGTELGDFDAAIQTLKERIANIEDATK